MIIQYDYQCSATFFAVLTTKKNKKVWRTSSFRWQKIYGGNALATAIKMLGTVKLEGK